MKLVAEEVLDIEEVGVWEAKEWSMDEKSGWRSE